MTCLSEPEAQEIALTNQYRVQHGLLPLSASAALVEAARSHAADMVMDPDYFSHTSRDGRDVGDRTEDAGYPMEAPVGENIAAGHEDAESTHDQWVNSRGHRENVLSRTYTEMGVGRAQGGRYGWVWVQVFGSGRTTLAKPCGGVQPARPPRPIPEPAPTPELPEPARLPTSRPPRQIRQQRRRMRRLLRRLGVRP